MGCPVQDEEDHMVSREPAHAAGVRSSGEGSDQTRMAALADGWKKRAELRQLRERYRALAAEIEADDQAWRRSKLTGLGPHQIAVLKALGDDFHDEGEDWAFSFSAIAGLSDLGRLQVSRACKALRRVGFVKHCIGLWDDDGTPAGAGYAITRHGREWLQSSEALSRSQDGQGPVRALSAPDDPRSSPPPTPEDTKPQPHDQIREGEGQ